MRAVVLLLSFVSRTAALASCAAPAHSAAAASVASASMRVAPDSLQMGTVAVAGFDGSKTGEEDVSLKIAKGGAYVVHRKVVAEQANMRLGTAVAKTRAEVSGGGRKPYQQKGTGRARRGSTRSPLIVGGGKPFGPRPRSYHLKMNKKEKQLAISTALMGALPRTTLVPDFESNFETPKSKEMKAFVERLGSDTSGKEKTMILIKERHEGAYLSARNIPYVNLRSLDNINARDILHAKKLVISQGAMETIKERYGAE